WYLSREGSACGGVPSAAPRSKTTSRCAGAVARPGAERATRNFTPTFPAPAPVAALEVEQIAVLQAIEDGIGAIARHRWLLLAGMLLAASRLGDSFFATPGAPAVDGTNPIALLLPLLRWRSVAWQAMRLVVDALADGYVVA